MSKKELILLFGSVFYVIMLVISATTPVYMWAVGIGKLYTLFTIQFFSMLIYVIIIGIALATSYISGEKKK